MIFSILFDHDLHISAFKYNKKYYLTLNLIFVLNLVYFPKTVTNQ